jgi:hypothetical protein
MVFRRFAVGVVGLLVAAGAAPSDAKPARQSASITVEVGYTADHYTTDGAVYADSKYLYLGSVDGTVRVWRRSLS